MKALTDKEIASLIAYCRIYPDEGLIQVDVDEESQEYALIKAYIFTAKYKGWRIIMQHEKG